MTARVAIALLALAGCSSAFTRGPSPSMLADPSVSCTDHHRHTIVDAIVGAAAAGGGLTVIILEQKDEPDYTSLPTYAIGIPLIAIGAAFLAASSKGHGKVSRCRQALRRRQTYEAPVVR